jgi:methylmalonyl-CoA/ethylmalonyl-CoA epimerase
LACDAHDRYHCILRTALPEMAEVVAMKIKRIEHVAIAVEDLEGSKKMLTDLFGLNLAYEEQINSVKLAMFPVGESYLELLHSKDPDTKTAKWIETKGQGLFHICLEVDDIVSALAELKSKGAKLLNEVPVTGHGNSKIAFIDPVSTSGFLIELVETSH